jgi:hypothetical protein
MVVVTTGGWKKKDPVTSRESTLRSFYRREWRRFALSVGFHLLSW